MCINNIKKKKKNMQSNNLIFKIWNYVNFLVEFVALGYN